MSSRLRLAVLAVSTPVLAFAVVGGFLGTASAREDTYQHLRVFEDVVSLISNNYVESVEMDRVMQGAMRGLAEGLDPDSSYLRPDEVRLVEQGAAGPDGDTGIVVTRQYYIRVASVRDGSSAARAGLIPGDVIRAIDGQSTRDVSVFTAIRQLRGAVGSKVSLTIIRGSMADPHVMDLVREKSMAPAVSGRIVAPGTGYIRIPTFAGNVTAQVGAKAADLTRAGATRFIIDVRRSAEGPYENGLAAARLFVPAGTLASREARGQTIETFTAQPGDGVLTQPVQVLMNVGTSGAAELFAAALAGNKRAETVGEKTIGRAATQKLIKLPDGSGLWLSWARYAGPDGETLQGKGVSPAVEVEEPDVEFGSVPAQGDPILEKALERLGVNKAA